MEDRIRIIELERWTKRTKIMCPDCKAYVGYDGRKRHEYTCKCGTILRPFVRLSF